MKKPILLLFTLVFVIGCANTDSSNRNSDIKLLEAQGFHSIKLKGYEPFKCSDSDNLIFTDAFTAISTAGVKVSGTICGAFLKGKTIRYN